MDDRIALRLGALRLARRRGRLRDAAWAASRLRLAGVTLEPGEARFARDIQVKLGHALRVARIRGPRPLSPNVTMPLLDDEPGSRRRQLLAALMAAALLLGGLLLYLRYQEPAGDPEGAPPVRLVAVATPPPPLRGRSLPGAAVPVAVVEVTPAPTEAPTAAPATPAPGSGSGTSGGGAGAGGSGGGSGTGNGRGTPAPTPTPQPTPTPTPEPTPTIDPANYMHVHGRVIDFVTRRGIPNVCYGPGIVSCAGAPVTDADGFWALDLTVAPAVGRPPSTWSISFITPGYVTGQDRFVGRRGDVLRPDVRMRVAQ
jgi:hypothetical protein